MFRITLSICLIIAFAGCNGQVQKISAIEIEFTHNPATPPLDSLESWCTLQFEKLKRIQKTDPEGIDQYLHNGKSFSGWACQTEPGNEHKYRYTFYRNSELAWQIGYYANGQLDHDFRMKDGKSMGSERMWMADGHLYIDHYYSAPGKMDGIQRRWHSNKILGRKALFDNGTLVYELLYDIEGNLTEKKGEVPDQE